MKLDVRQMRIAILTIATLYNAMATANGQQFPLLTLSNAIPTNSSAVANSEPVSKTNETVPVIEMRDVSMSAGIQNLARQAGINCLLDARLSKWWSMPDSDGNTTHEPILNFRWENLSAKQALLQLLKEHNLVLLEDTVTSVARVTYIHQVVNSMDDSLLGNDTNIISIIQFQDVPLTSGLQSLARQANFNYMLDPQVDYGLPDRNGQIRAEPLLFIRWESLTAKQAFVAICENYDLVFEKDLASKVVLIRAKDHRANFMDANLLGNDTNIIPVIQFQDVPITTALKSLAHLADFNYTLNPQIGYGLADKNGQIKAEPTLSFRWESITAKEAFIAICENYDLVVIKASKAGLIQIETRN
jgi:hypothetical protein